MIKKFLDNYDKFLPRWTVYTADMIVIVTTFFMAYFIRFNLTLDFDKKMLLIQLPVLIVIATICFFYTGSFKGVVRHTGFKDLMTIFNAVLLLALFNIALVSANKITHLIAGYTIPKSIIIIHSLLSFVALSFYRLLFRFLYKYVFVKKKTAKNVVIYGAGDSGIVAYKVLVNKQEQIFDIINFIDDDPSKVGKVINGVPVISRNKLTNEYIIDNDIHEIIVAIYNIEGAKLRHLVDGLMELKVTVKIIPSFEKWINGEFNVNQIKKVKIEDLLGRVPIEINNPRLNEEFKGEIIMVTGAAGSIGSELTRQIANYDLKKLILIDQAESALYDLQQELRQKSIIGFNTHIADIRDKERMDFIFNLYKPTMVFHAAAYKHVPLMEDTPYEAIKINVGGTKNLADLASVYKAKKFVFVSTDKAVNPTSVMGASKRLAEMYIGCMQKRSNTKYITTRFGNVLGSNGSVIPLFKRQIENGGPLTLTHKEITRYFMTIPEASQLVLEAGAMGKGGEIFIFDMGESIKIFDLAKNMIKLSGLRYPEDINITITGLRPGEKLYEELLANGENTIPTYHPKIMISKTRELLVTEVKTRIEEICVMNLFQNNDHIIAKIKCIIPEYKSNNSKFEVFDQNGIKPESPAKRTGTVATNRYKDKTNNELAVS
ncbi:polysaccharide biosynthesis protein [Abyssalbus ytuae]|uniref:Polysaccharide biosynthesis protein n=1 Tax=Abyssalbus ytuae TaxID=2926907 RepID=A0A9E6ZK26_9FLAO|nr:nucleoside-diphosphate sugar epimerase/dehydratase [Abyssalbus ytuae]UOB17084.1 polysaccharide biosynthesis protein [Abyssalbus ytuae]